MDKILIIIPTYNEAENIDILLNDLLCGHLIDNINVLVVDDNSPDGTSTIVENIMKENKKLFILKREKKEGLGKAYIAGFLWALDKGYDIICQMDADFSHNPIYLKGITKAAKKYDFVIGSRYVRDGGIIGWNLLRRIISIGGSLYARIILGCPIHDMTGGFNVWNAKVLKSLDLINLYSSGYSFQIEMKYRAYKKGFSYYEYPIIFEDRQKGLSKMSKKIVTEALKNVWKIKFAFIKEIFTKK